MIRELKQIGLTDGEIKVYEALLELGSSSTGKIIKKSGISGSKVYEVLDRLHKKGLVGVLIRNNVQYFEASSPERLLTYLDDKEEELTKEKLMIKSIIPQLLLKQHLAPKSEAKIFTGWEGLKTANEDIITSLHKGQTWYSMGLTEQPKSWERYFNKQQVLRAKKGIIHRHLLNEKYKSLYMHRKKLPHTEFRFLPKQLEMPTSIEIYGSKVCIMILTPASPFALIITSLAVAESFRKYFIILWSTAKKLK